MVTSITSRAWCRALAIAECSRSARTSYNADGTVASIVKSVTEGTQAATVTTTLTYDPLRLQVVKSVESDGGAISLVKDSIYDSATGRLSSTQGPYVAGSTPGPIAMFAYDVFGQKGMVVNRGTPNAIGFSANLDPQFSPNPWRFDLRFHPDEAPIGTQGCIGISSWDAQDFYNSLNDYFYAQGNATIGVWVTP